MMQEVTEIVESGTNTTIVTEQTRYSNKASENTSKQFQNHLCIPEDTITLLYELTEDWPNVVRTPRSGKHDQVTGQVTEAIFADVYILVQTLRTMKPRTHDGSQYGE